MKRIIVASQNPVKLQAVMQGYASLFPDETLSVEGVSVDSGVSAQPFSDQETLQGARQRAENARSVCPEADLWVGVEGGVADDGDITAFAWVVVLSHSQEGKAKTATFYLPEGIAELTREGVELGDADDIVFGRSNSKQQNGAIGLLTDDVIDRAGLYQPAVVMALLPFKHPVLYHEKQERHAPETWEGLQISPMTLADYDAMMALWQSTPGIGLSGADGRPEIARFLEANRGLCFCAYDGDSLVGTVLCGHDTRRGYIYHLLVQPDYRRRGLGEELVNHCLAGLREAGVQKCHIFVFTDNLSGLAFWQDTGWVMRPELSILSHNL
mgnify:CR=1 FL=1